MYKINQFPPNLNIAIKVANKLDEIGIHKDANLIDEFIKKSKNLEITKQAGLWSAIWNRLGGLTKRLFFKEYRELYDSAKEANKKIKERMDKAKELLKESEVLFNNYELLQWREKVRLLPVYTKDLMFDFESKFGKLVAFTYKLQQTGEVPSSGEFGLKDISAPEGTEETKKQEKIPGISEFKEMVQKSRESKDGEPPWPRHGLLQLFAIPPEKDAVAIWSDYFNKDIFNIHLAKNKNGNFVLTTEGRTKRPGARIAAGWFENFFKGEWKLEKEEGGWIYLRRVKEEAEKVPQETKTEKEILMPKSPASLLPGALPGAGPATESVMGKEPTAAELTPKELDENLGEIKEIEMLEEKKEEDLRNKMLQDIQNYEWVVFTSGPNKGQYGLLKKTLIEGGKSKYGEFSPIIGQEEVNKLNNAYFEKFYKDKEKKVKGVGKKFKLEEGKLTKASMVNNLLFRGK